jgi:hypothetical protein
VLRPLLCAGLVALCGCGEDPPPTPTPQSTDPRAEQARAAQALNAVGYDGAAVEQNLLRTITTQDDQQAQRDAARRAAAGE